ncbi:MAG: cytochrome c [Bacteroidia bacterium]|nr:cytochrome c [Bacteroidia bacterium]
MVTRRNVFFFLIIVFLIYSTIIFFSGVKGDIGVLSKNGQKGKLHFQKYNCIACHQLYGLGGYMGPDLTNIISEKGKGREYARAFILNGTYKMPNFNISRIEAEELLDYLDDIDRSGQSKLKQFKINFNGTISFLNEYEK